MALDQKADVAKLKDGLATLVKRLDAGAEKILAAKAAGAPNAAALEDFWLVLLAQYEATFDRLAALGEGGEG